MSFETRFEAYRRMFPEAVIGMGIIGCSRNKANLANGDATPVDVVYGVLIGDRLTKTDMRERVECDMILIPCDHRVKLDGDQSPEDFLVEGLSRRGWFCLKHAEEWRAAMRTARADGYSPEAIEIEDRCGRGEGCEGVSE